VICSDLRSPAEASTSGENRREGFAQAGNRFLPGITPAAVVERCA